MAQTILCAKNDKAANGEDGNSRGLGIPANTSGPPVNQFANWLQLRSGLFPDCLALGSNRFLGYCGYAARRSEMS